MRTCLKFFVITIFLIAFLIPNACAEYDGEIINIDSMRKGLMESEIEEIGELDEFGFADTEGAVQRLWDKCLAAVKAEAGKDISMLLSLFALAVIGAVLNTLNNGAEFRLIVKYAVCSSAVILCMQSSASYLETGIDAVRRISVYSKSAFPAVFTFSAIAGSPVSSAAKYAVCCLAVDILISLSERFILPMINAYTALRISAVFCENSILDGVSAVLKWIVTVMLTGVVFCFSAYLAITGVISGSTDAVAVKASKTIISMTLPVVGGMISDAAAVVLSSAKIMSSAAGIFGLLAVSFMCAEPFIAIFTRTILLRLAANICVITDDKALPKMLNDIASASAMMSGMVGACAIMMFISFTSAIKTVMI